MHNTPYSTSDGETRYFPVPRPRCYIPFASHHMPDWLFGIPLLPCIRTPYDSRKNKTTPSMVASNTILQSSPVFQKSDLCVS